MRAEGPRLEGAVMAELIAQFEEACSNVEPEKSDKEHAAEAHEDVRDKLDDDESLSSRGPREQMRELPRVCS